MCACSMLWMRSWLLESSLIGPRCVDGTLLREMRLSRDECLHEENRIEHVAPGCEAELLSVPTDGRQTFGLDHWMSLRNENLTTKIDGKNNLSPSPEETDYFYDEFVDYPINMTSLTDTIKNNIRKPTNNNKNQQASSHYIPGDTPTIYAASNNNNKSKLQPPKEVTGSPSSSGFTFFGVPLPSLGLNNLFGNNGRMTEKYPTVPSLLLQTPVAQRKTAIVNKPNNNFKHTIKLPPTGLPTQQIKLPSVSPTQPIKIPPSAIQMPPTVPDVQTGGFLPILPGEGGFLPMIPPSNQTKPNSFSVDVNKVNVKPESSNISPTRLPVSTHSYILEDDRFQNMGHPIAIPTENSVSKNQERRSTTAIPKTNAKLQKLELPKNLTKSVVSTKSKNGIADNGVKVVEITPTTPKTTTTVATTSSTTQSIATTVSTTKKPKKSQSYGDLEIASDAQSFDEIFKDIVENVSVPESVVSTTTAPVVTPPSSTSTTSLPIPIKNDVKISTNAVKKEDGTILSTLLAPSGLQPPHRSNVKSSITKVQSPHMPPSESISAPENLTDLSFADDVSLHPIPDDFDDDGIAPMAHNREAKNAYTNSRKQDEPVRDSKEENNWYFTNYNKTNLEPFVGPGSDKFPSSANNTKVACEFLLFLCIILANLM